MGIFDVGDIIEYGANKEFAIKMLILKILPQEVTYGIKYEVLMLGTNQINKFIFYPIDKFYIKKIA